VSPSTVSKPGVLDECAFYRDETSATPDEEVYAAIKPALASIPGSMLIGISSGHKKAGLLYRKFRQNYGKDGDILVVRASTRQLNPTIPQSVVDEAFEEDPAVARSEWMGEFRDDVDSFVTLEAVESCIEPGALERPPVAGLRYACFIDPAGGSGQDSMTLAIAHREKELAVLDVVREVKPPFSPDVVTADFLAVMRRYRITAVVGDRWGSDWVQERFRKAGVRYVVSEKPKSDLYKEMLPNINCRRALLLDHKKLIAQLVSLERRVSRGGRDSIDHPADKKSHDDVANAVAGALTVALGNMRRRLNIDDELLRFASTPEHLDRHRYFGPSY
jgi:hypothetical protein